MSEPHEQIAADCAEYQEIIRALDEQLQWFVDREPDVTRTIKEVVELRASVDKLRESLGLENTEIPK